MNPLCENSFIKYITKLRNISDIELAHKESYLKHSRIIYDSLVDLLPILSNYFNTHRIIIRPHPSENKQNWIKASKKLNNVDVVSKGAIGPWLYGASAIVHNGCTTGLEAFLMGKPVFSYMPFKSKDYDLQLPNNVSICCESADSLIQKISAVLKNGIHCSDEEKREIATRFIHNAGKNYAFKTIANNLIEASEKINSVKNSELALPFIPLFTSYFRQFVRLGLVTLFRAGIPMPQKIKNINYGLQKNPGISTNELKTKITTLSSLLNISIDKLTVKRLDAHNHIISNK